MNKKPAAKKARKKILEDDDWSALLIKIKDKLCTPFLGAGACYPVLPLGREIAEQLANKYHYPLPDKYNLSKVTQFIATEKGFLTCKSEVKQLLQDHARKNNSNNKLVHETLARLPFPIYITTNYDDFMVEALKKEKKQPIRDYYRWNRYLDKKLEKEKKIDDGFEPSEQTPLVYHLHGIWEVPQSLVVTEDDYIDYLIDYLVNVSKDSNGKLHHRVSRSLAGTTLLFIGYNLEDISFRTLFKSVVHSIEGGLRPRNISIQLKPIQIHRKLIREDLTNLENITKNFKSQDSRMERFKRYLDDLQEVIGCRAITSGMKTDFLKKTIELEDFITQFPNSGFDKDFAIKIINRLQEEISRITTADDRNKKILKYLEEYYSGSLKINIYWTDANKFVRELWERWQQYQNK